MWGNMAWSASGRKVGWSVLATNEHLLNVSKLERDHLLRLAAEEVRGYHRKEELILDPGSIT